LILLLLTKPKELLNQAWNKEKKEEKSPNVLRMINMFNLLSSWVASTIIDPVRVKQRAHRLEKLIKIAEVSFLKTPTKTAHNNNHNADSTISLALDAVKELSFLDGFH
jgi:hypothetical protein